MNLVTTIASFITPMIANRIAGSLGIPPGIATTAIGAILPTVLAGLVGKAATPAGAAGLFETLGRQDPNLLGSFADQIGGSGQKALIDNGSAMLGSLLGGPATGALSTAVGKFSGASPEQASSLIGMLAPVVLGGLGQQVRSSSLDAGGVANLLAGQKANIAAAMPPGFADLLSGSGLLDGIASNLAAIKSPPATPSVPRVELPPANPGGFGWLPWAAGAVAVVALVYTFGGFGSRPAPKGPDAAQLSAAAATASEKARQIVAGLTSTLQSVKDEATAKAAVPKLTESVAAIDTLMKMHATLGAENKSVLAKLIGGALPQLTPLIASAIKIPGAEAVLKPVLDQIVTKLTALSKI